MQYGAGSIFIIGPKTNWPTKRVDSNVHKSSFSYVLFVFLNAFKVLPKFFACGYNRVVLASQFGVFKTFYTYRRENCILYLQVPPWLKVVQGLLNDVLYFTNQLCITKPSWMQDSILFSSLHWLEKKRDIISLSKPVSWGLISCTFPRSSHLFCGSSPRNSMSCRI